MNKIDVESISNEELRDLLIKNGSPCGPIVKTTRKVYENKLRKLLTAGRRSEPSTPDRSAATATAIDNRLYPSLDNRSGSDRSSDSSFGSGGGAGNRFDGNRATKGLNRSGGGLGGGNYFDASDDNYDDDKMEGEESFRYVGPVNDTPPSPYSALGGSMIATPPAPPRPTTTASSTIGHRLDYGFQPTPFKSSSQSQSKTASISYHTAGPISTPYGATEPYRRQIPVQHTSTHPRTAAPTNPYAINNENKSILQSIDSRSIMGRLKRWGPMIGMGLAAVVVIVFTTMFIKRAMQGGDGGEDDEAKQLPP